MESIGYVTVPGKAILLGEHAVVYGEPAISMAISRGMTVLLQKIENGGWFESHRPIGARTSPYITEAFIKSTQEFGKPQTSINMVVDSTIPPASGLGSSAAITTATVASVLATLKYEGREDIDINSLRHKIARVGHAVEAYVQGSASPIDTTTVTYGGGILVGKRKILGYNHLWSARLGDKRWELHSVDIPEDFHFVLGYTGIKGNTARLVARVKSFVTKNRFGMEVIKDIGDLTIEGLKAIRHADAVEMGRIMTKNHNLLTILGVSHPMLDKLVDAVLPYSYGAKLTGAGGGGCMIALVPEERVKRVVDIIANLNAKPIVVKVSAKGVDWRLFHSSDAEST